MIKKDKIIVRDYDPIWSKCFEELKQIFENHLGGLILAVEHVGSTSVVGLAAKPIIDVDLIVEDNEKIKNLIIKKLAELGYVHRGDLGLVGREAFKRKSSKVPFDSSGRIWMNHHLYVCRKNSVSLLNHLELRDFLRQNAEARTEYEKLKKELAEKFPFDIDGYMEGKTTFIVKTLKTLNFEDDDLKRIEDQNRSK